MVRHGSYITVFSNLSGASVKAGEKVRAGDKIDPYLQQAEAARYTSSYGKRPRP